MCCEKSSAWTSFIVGKGLNKSVPAELSYDIRVENQYPKYRFGKGQSKCKEMESYWVKRPYLNIERTDEANIYKWVNTFSCVSFKSIGRIPVIFPLCIYWQFRRSSDLKYVTSNSYYGVSDLIANGRKNSRLYPSSFWKTTAVKKTGCPKAIPMLNILS